MIDVFGIGNEYPVLIDLHVVCKVLEYISSSIVNRYENHRHELCGLRPGTFHPVGNFVVHVYHLRAVSYVHHNSPAHIAIKEIATMIDPLYLVGRYLNAPSPNSSSSSSESWK